MCITPMYSFKVSVSEVANVSLAGFLPPAYFRNELFRVVFAVGVFYGAVHVSDGRQGEKKIPATEL